MDSFRGIKFMAALFYLAAIVAVRGEETTTDRVVVSADRLPDAGSSAPFSVTALESEDLLRAPQLRLDDILRNAAPGFSLFRRNSSRTANPTTQGVTLRNFGPSGAGRTLVLLDGIPLNDPFAGYVLWSQVPTAAIQTVLVQPGSGAGLFGNAALAGTVFLTSTPLEEIAATGDFWVGNYATYDFSAVANVAGKPIAFGMFAERFSTGGYPVIAAEQHGRVDRNATADSALVDLRAGWQIDAETSLALRGRFFSDERGNGTAYTRNETEGADWSTVLERKFPVQSAELQISLYGQRRKFSSTFSSINRSRTVETPALDQFDVPADAFGGSAVWSVAAGRHRIVLGGDARSVTGETNEFFFWNGTTFTRLREAGGEQFFAGAFAEDTWAISDRMTAVGSLRADRWELTDGFRRETERATGASRLNTRFVNRTGDEINGRLGLRVKATKDLAVRGAVFSGFRVPTLNELYRPFRVGNDVTEANPNLEPEHLLGAEAGAEWQATSTLRLTATGFVNRLEDAVGNITIGFGPGTFDPGGFIPAGGVLRQRRNIDLVVAPGVEATAEWQVVPTLKLKFGYLFTRPIIERATDTALVGNILAQTPQHVLTGAVEWNPTTRWSLGVQIRHSSSQFEDDQNSRRLAAFTVCDAMAAYSFNQRVSAAVRVENVFDTEIQTGRSAEGLVSIGAPRLVTLQVRLAL
ncbi:MAG TPA: TonB-dependent receptor [Chthoniobacterales bacterium]|nr:TonB-dependent receptor [Chthoniobacterales bacterium]